MDLDLTTERLAGARNLSAVLRGTVDSRLEHLKFDPRFSTSNKSNETVDPVAFLGGFSPMREESATGFTRDLGCGSSEFPQDEQVKHRHRQVGSPDMHGVEVPWHDIETVSPGSAVSVSLW